MRLPVFLLPFALAGCIASPRPGVVDGSSPFSPQEFFAGGTEGEGMLKKLFSPVHPVHVHGTGRIAADGGIILDQLVDEEGKPPNHREWRIRKTGPGQYTGTLTGAVGPIAGTVTGNCFHLHFHMKGGLDAEQWMYLSTDRRSAHNLMRVRKFGVTVARLDETIRKTG